MKKIIVSLFLLLPVGLYASSFIGGSPTIQEFQAGFMFPEPVRDDVSGGAPQNDDVALDAAGEKHAAVFQIPKSGTIEGGVQCFGSITTGGTLGFRLETVTADTGFPSGTLYHANSTGTAILGNDDDFKCLPFDFDGTFTANQGDFVALLTERNAAGAFSVGTDIARISQFPVVIASNSTTGWVKETGFDTPYCALRYSDDSYYPVSGIMPSDRSGTSVTIGSNTTPSHAGVRFQVKAKAQLHGVNILLTPAAADYNVLVYDSNGASTMTYVTVDGGVDSSGVTGVTRLVFKDGVTLEKDTWYRVVINPITTTTLAFTSYNVAVVSGSADDVFDALPYGSDFHYTAATNPTQESDWTNTTTRRPPFSLILNGVAQ